MLADWQPAPAPGMSITAFIDLEDESSGTRYAVRVLHPDAATRQRHEAMGFHEGWGTCIQQLDDYARSLG